MIRTTPISGMLFPPMWGEVAVKPSFEARGELRFPYRPSGSYETEVRELARGLELRWRYLGGYPVPMDVWWGPGVSPAELEAVFGRLTGVPGLARLLSKAARSKKPHLVNYGGGQVHWAEGGVWLALQEFIAELTGIPVEMTPKSVAAFRLDYFGLESAIMGNTAGGSALMAARLEAYAESWNAFRTRYKDVLPQY